MIMQNNDGGRFDRSRPQASPQPEASTQQDIAAGQMYGFVPLDPNATVYRLDAAHRTILNHHLNRQAEQMSADSMNHSANRCTLADFWLPRSALAKID